MELVQQQLSFSCSDEEKIAEIKRLLLERHSNLVVVCGGVAPNIELVLGL
jgi:hypothetical protein